MVIYFVYVLHPVDFFSSLLAKL